MARIGTLVIAEEFPLEPFGTGGDKDFCQDPVCCNFQLNEWTA
jgi:hypothetical protein